MPSFDVASEVDMAEVKNAVNMTRKELQHRFDFRGTDWEIEEEKSGMVISAQDEFKLKSLSQVLMQKLASRGVSLKNIDPQQMEVSSVGRARQLIRIKQGLETDMAKRISRMIKETKLKVQTQVQDQKVRVTGKSRNDLQSIIQMLKGEDLPVGLSFDNFRD